MNAPKIIELAIAQVLLDHAELGAETSVRPWRSLASTKTDQSRVLPCVDIRCAAAQHNEDQATQTCACEVEMRTAGADDADHAIVAAMEESVRDTLERLYDQTKVGSGAEYSTFVNKAAELSGGASADGETYTGGEFLPGGFRFDAGSAPFDDDDENTLSISITADFAKSGG